MNYSLTQSGNLTVLVGVIVWASKTFLNFELSSDEVTNVVSAVLMVSGVVASWYGRFRHGDVTISGFRK
jgi:hypothetical protein